MIISCVKWGDKFSHEHVNRLFKMCQKHFGEDYRFICHTDDSTGIISGIEIRELDLDLDLENWWWKLQLFDEDRFPDTKRDKHLFFDLDVVIQGDLQPIVDCIQKDKVTLVKALWKSYPLKYPDMNNNSSVMAWEGDLSYIWRKFNRDPEKYLFKYNGIDGYMTHECEKLIENFPEGLIYSRLFGVNSEKCFEPIEDNQPDGNYFYEPDYTVCIFNSLQNPVFKYKDGTYWLDNDAYKGMEHYWQSEWSRKNHSGINRNLWNALWECSINGGDVHHFLDSLSPNQIESKMWLVESLTNCIKPSKEPKKVQLFGGWFAHPISSILLSAFKNIEWIENIDLDENALHVCRIINADLPIIIDTQHRNVLDPGARDWDTDLVINTSSEHMPPLPVILENRNFRKSTDDTSQGPCIFAIQSNNMFHVKDHINCVKSEDELERMCEFTKVLYKGSLDMPNGYKRFMVIGYV